MTDDTLTAAVARLRIDIATERLGKGFTHADDTRTVLAALEAAQTTAKIANGFHGIAVKQRDAAWRECETLRADLEAEQADAASANDDLMSESRERLALLRRFERVVTELRHLEQAYANKHSPQHRAAALNSAQGVLAAIDAAMKGEEDA